MRISGMLLLLGVLPASAQVVQVIPQVADGAGWSTTIVLVNRTASAASVQLSFRQDTANGATASWTPPFVEGVSLSNISLAAGSAFFLHTTGTAAQLAQGWGQMTAPDGVSGYAIFTTTSPGNTSQDSTAPAVPAASRILVPFDNTNGLVSAVAVANPNGSAETILVNIRTADGTTTTATLPSMPANGHIAVLLPNQFPETAGKRGLAEFYVTSGSLSMIALRARTEGGGAITSAPVYFQSGPPILSGGGSSPGTGTSITQVIPQVADGNEGSQAWSTTIVLTNTTTAEQQVAMNFKMAVLNGAGVTTAWNPPLLESVSTSGFTIPAGSTLFLHTPGTAGTLSQGWAELIANGGVQGYAIFTVRPTGKTAQDSTAPAVSASGRILVPFDNTSGLVTAVAAVNPTAAAASVSVNIRTSDGTTSSATQALPAQGQITFLMPSQFDGLGGKSGLAEFYVTSGTLSFIALRANPTGGITSAPVYFETGSPIITTGGGGPPSGGGGGSTTPTQAEIDAWVAKGNYSAGVISLSRSTAYAVDILGNASGPTKTDDFTAEFGKYGGSDLGKILRGELPAGFPNMSPGVGNCVVYNLNALTTVPYPNLTYTGLDAGPQITSAGPNGTQQALRKSSPSVGFTYSATGVPNTYLSSGRYTLSGPGGANVGAFSGTLDIVQEFVVTNNPDDFKVINRGGGVTARWSGGDSSALVTIAGSSTNITTQSTTAFVCMQNVSAGSFTVPSSILSQLPASTGVGGFFLRGTFTVSAHGKGARFTAPSGLDILTAGNDWSWSYTPQYQ